MQKKITAALGLMITLVMLFTFSVSTFSATAATSTTYDQYLADYLISSAEAQSYINRDYYIPYRKYVEDRKNSDVYQGLLAAWEIATFNGSAASKADKAVAYYETILYDTIVGDTSSFPIVDTLDSTFSSIKAGTYKTIFDYCASLDEFELVDLVELEDISLNDPLFNDLVKQLSLCQELKESFKLLDTASDVIGDAKTIVEVIDRVSALEALTENKNQMKQILTDINTSTSDPALALACLKMSSVLDDTYSSDTVIKGLLAGEGLVKVYDKATGAAWDMVLEAAVGAGLTVAVKAGQKLGKLGAGILFSTDKDVECVYSMTALYEIEDRTVNLVKSYQSRYKSNPTDANAKLYTEAFKQLMRIYMQGVDYSLQYGAITNEQGLLNQLFKKFESDDYKKYVSLLNSLKDTFAQYLDFIDTCVYNNYLAGIPNTVTYSQIKKKMTDAKTTSVTDDDVKIYLNYSETVSNAYTNRVIDKDWTLTEDVTMFGNLTVNANVDLNGHTLTINGDVDHNSGEILFHNGSLIIDGDYLNATPNVDGGQKEYYDMSYGMLKMVWDDDYMLVGGNFITNMYHYNSYKNTFSTGIIEIKGNVLDYTTDNRAWNAAETNKVILSGSGNQTIHLDSTSAYMNNLEIQNSASRSITISKYCKVNGITSSDKSNLKVTSKSGIGAFGTLQSTNLTVTGDFELGNGSTTLQKSNIDIKGNLTVSSNIDLNSCKIHATGMCDHNSGEVLFHNGSLIIDGDYLNATPNVDSGQKEYYDMSYGMLKMVWDDDYMLVGGNFITNIYHYNSYKNTFSTGIIEIKGNVLDYTTDSRAWNAAETNKVILSGSGNQTIHLNNSSAYLNNLEIQNTGSKILAFTGYFKATNVIINTGNVTIKSDSTNAKITDVLMRTGAKVTLTGNMNGITAINKASVKSDMTSCASTSGSTITAVAVGNTKVTASNSSDSTTINVVVENPFEMGDVNCDGEINVADAVLLQKWLLAVPNTRLPNWKYANLCNDDRLDVFDLCLLKRKLIYG